MTRPNVRTFPVKSVEQQNIQAVHRARQQLVTLRTALVNQIWAMLYEYGIIIPKGINHAGKKVPEILEDAANDLSGLAHGLIIRVRK